jgi:hypothetical protein
MKRMAESLLQRPQTSKEGGKRKMKKGRSQADLGIGSIGPIKPSLEFRQSGISISPHNRPSTGIGNAQIINSKNNKISFGGSRPQTAFYS